MEFYILATLSKQSIVVQKVISTRFDLSDLWQTYKKDWNLELRDIKTGRIIYQWFNTPEQNAKREWGRLLTPEIANPKTKKSQGSGYYSAIMHLSPANLSGFQVCPAASQGCIKSCLNFAGRGRFNSIQIARLWRTILFFRERALFFTMLYKEINTFIKRAHKNELTPAIRLNGTSDIIWEKIKNPNTGRTALADFAELQFYDYTKIYNRLLKDIPNNYHLTFSAAENNDKECMKVLARGFNVAAVFNKNLPETYWGFKVTNADSTDLRFLDPKGTICGLVAKGPAKKDTSGFVKEVLN